VIWSLPPTTWYFSFDGPKMRSWPWPLYAQEIEHVQHALLVRVGAVLDRVGDVEELPELRRHAARHVRLDPVDDRHVIELAAARRERVIQGRIARGAEVGVQLLPNLLEVVGRLRIGVVRTVEVVRRLSAVGLGAEEVVELET